MLSRAVSALTILVALSQGVEAGCQSKVYAGYDYTVCTYDPAVENIALFNLDEHDEPYRYFGTLAQKLAGQGKQLIFAMNAGMFDSSQRPIGLYVEDGVVAKKLNRRGGYGNFHLKPNGVFVLDDGKAWVMETERFARSGKKPQFATQSGPMLVIDGNIHPKFSKSGTSLKTRNGVGVRDDGTVVFAISDDAVNFYQFASLFRDELDCANALFLDGTVSSLFSKELGRNDGYLPLGPMIGVYELK